MIFLKRREMGSGKGKTKRVKNTYGDFSNALYNMEVNFNNDLWQDYVLKTGLRNENIINYYLGHNIIENNISVEEASYVLSEFIKDILKNGLEYDRNRISIDEENYYFKVKPKNSFMKKINELDGYGYYLHDKLEPDKILEVCYRDCREGPLSADEIFFKISWSDDEPNNSPHSIIRDIFENIFD